MSAPAGEPEHGPVEALNKPVDVSHGPPEAEVARKLADMRTEIAAIKAKDISHAIPSEGYWASDHALRRFLHAREYVPADGARMYAATMAFRRDKGIDTVLERVSEPVVMRHFFPWGIIGFDRDGFPLLVERVGQVDLIGMYAAMGTEPFLDWVCWYHEAQERMMRRATARAGGDRHRMTCIIDAGGLSLRHISSATLNVLKRRTRMEEDNYPEVVRRIFLINTPSMFATVWGVIKYFMDEGTRNKMHILGSDFLPTVTKYVDPKYIPACLGGTLRDAEGHAHCYGLVGPGGLVHMAYFADIPQDHHGNGEEVNIAAGKHSDVLVRVPAGATVHWKWGMTDKDINFSVHAVAAAEAAPAADVINVTRTVAGVHQLASGYKPLPSHDFSPHVVHVSSAGKLDDPIHGAAAGAAPTTVVGTVREGRAAGSYTASVASIVRLRWDNSYSWMSSKTLARRVDVTLAGETLDSPTALIELHPLERVARARYVFQETFATDAPASAAAAASSH